MTKIKVKDWDSTFFGYLIGELVLDINISYDMINELLENSKRFKLIYIVLPGNMELPIRRLKNFKIELIDKKIVYKKKIDILDMPNCISVKSIIGQNPKDFYKLAIESGEYSRFKLDKNFINYEFHRLYYEWIRKSISGDISDEVFAFFVNNSPVGLVTMKLKNKITTIGLIAVDKNARGKGIGNKLLQQVEYFAIQNGSAIINVSTQLDNELACSFYVKNGYVKESQKNIYHLWNL